MPRGERRASEESDGFSKMFPSATGRDGRVRRNSARTGRGQGRGTTKRMVRCKQCGFLFDANRTAHDGQSQDGEGGLGNLTKYSDSYTVSGVSRTDTYASQTARKGAGCPLCGTRNGVA